MSIVRNLAHAATLSLGRIKRNQRVSIPPEYTPVKVNLGCGLAVASGWINIDGSFNALAAGFPRFAQTLAYRGSGANRYYSEAEYCGVLRNNYFIHHDLSFGVPLADAAADFMYSSHFLEHLFRKDALHILKEIYRVLRPGGRVRIAIPDLEYAVSLYKSGDKEKMLSNFFFVEDKDTYYSRHKYMYDFEMIASALGQAGFKDIRRFSYQEGNVPDIDVLDKYPDESLFVEAIR